MINMKSLAGSAVSQLFDMTREKVIRHGLNWLARAGLRRIPVVLWRGTARTGQAGRLLVAGDDPWVRYLPQRFFEGESTCEPIGRVEVRALPRLVEEFRKSIDMAVLRIDRLSHSKVFPSGYLVVPEWVGTKLLVPDDINALVRSSSNIARDVRRVRSRKFEPMVTSDGQGLDRFYQSFYLPLSKARYGQLLIVRPIYDLRRRLRRGGILWACQKQEPVAALLFEQKRDTLDVLAVGTLDGNPALMKEGALAALYYFIIDLARTRACRVVDFRGSRPSLRDGVLRYKCKWGATLYDKADSFYDLLVWWPEVTAVIRDFLNHTPLIYRDEGGFSGLVGSEPQRAHDLRINGLRRLSCLTELDFREIPN